MKKIVGFLLVLLVLSTADAFALSCRGRFISVGMEEWEVYDLCGEPEHVRTWQEHVAPAAGYVGGYVFVVPGIAIATYEEWVYNFGPNHLMPILTFRNGRLHRMKTGNYGY